GRPRPDRRRGGEGRSGPRRHDRRPRSRHPGGAAAAGVRAVFHDQAGRHGPGAGAGAADDRVPQRHDPGLGDDGRRGHVRHRAGDPMSPRILLVDDETNIRKMVGALLQSEGFETAEAANGTAAIAAVERETPDAVLLDLMMPGGPDGLIRSSRDRKSTRLNSSHQIISYAVFCLKKTNSSTDTQCDIMQRPATS